MQRTVLLIAYHFPPIKGSSGVQRTLRFAQHLPKYGWQPIVLTIDPQAYEAVSRGVGNEIPRELEVHRVFGRDAARSFSILGRYPRALALPDRWAIWRYQAVRKAMRIANHRRLDAIWSTFPIATAHRIGLDVANRTGLPWIAEFRDPMWQGDYPTDPVVNRSWLELERAIFGRADSIVVAAPSAVSVYAERYPEFGESRITLIENGYDEETFRRAEAGLMTRTNPVESSRRPVSLLHSGLIYASERDPTQLFAALASLKQAGKVSPETLHLTLRASGDEADYRARVGELGIDDIVSIQPAIDYLAALREMFSADGLLILQASNCNAQIPAKLYEYLRAGRPILALTDPSGDTARTLASAGVGRVVPLDSAPRIAEALLTLMDDIRGDAWRRADPAVIARYSREAQAKRLAQCLDDVAMARGGAND